MSKRRSLLVALSGIFAAALGTLWWRRRSVPTPAPIEIVKVESAPLPIVESEPLAPAVPLWIVLSLRLIAAAFGLLSLTQAQVLLLESRMPFAPVVLFAVGIALISPLVANHNLEAMRSPAQFTLMESSAVESSTADGKSRSALYLVSTTIFVFFSLVIAQFGRATPLFWLTWAFGIAAILAGTLTIDKAKLSQLPRFWRQLMPDAAAVVLLPVILGILLRLTYAPETPLPSQSFDLLTLDVLANNQIPDYYWETSPFYLYLENTLAGPTRELPDMQRFSGIFALLLVPVTYIFAWAIAGRWVAIFTAGFITAGLWTLALAKSGSVYPALAVCTALYLIVLFYRSNISRAQYIIAGLIVGIGWLITPEFAYMLLMLPVRSLFAFLDEPPPWWYQANNNIIRLYRTPIVLLIPVIIFTPLLIPLILGYRWLRAQRTIPNSCMTLLIMLVVVLPFVRLAPGFRWIPTPNISPDFELLTGVPPLYTVIDALAYNLLAFNLTRDPSPVHGIINRPLFMPLLGALFITGLLAWAWHSYHTQRWREGWLLAALVVALLPSALNLPLPLTYPDAWRAAIGLPIAVVLAGYGAGIVAHSLQQLLGRVGIGAAIVLVVISLVFIGNDARLHYNNIALPTYERAAPFIEQP